MIQTVLIDRRNIDRELPHAIDAVRSASLVGLDCETEDDGRHPGLNFLMKVNEDTRKKAGNKRLLFDMRRTTVCGFSIYPESHDKAWYVNLAHADVENRVPFSEVRALLDAKPANALWLAHNAPFELTVFQNSLEYALQNIACTMQLSVTAFGNDNYDLNEFRMRDLGGMRHMPEALLRAAMQGGDELLELDDESDRRFSRQVEELIGKICAKEANTASNYNGWVDELAYGHGLKQLVLRFFGYQMGTFQETLGENAHMGQLTGDEVRDYGAEDAYWVVPLFRKLMEHVAINSPNALETFFAQENPMIHVYADAWTGGMRVNHEAIYNRRDVERMIYAQHLRDLKIALKRLTWPTERNDELARRETWYDKNWERYRGRWAAFRDAPTIEDDFSQTLQVKGSVSTSWAEEKGLKTEEFSVMHYMPIRTLLYDILGARLQFEMGKVASDAEARGKVKTWLEKNDPDPAKLAVLDLLAAMGGVETRMKLYLTPFIHLTDPETGYLYPTLNSLLNTRRLAASSPNLLALAKRGESTYVRGFFKGDNPCLAA